MIYTVAEVAEKVNLSKASIYVRMKTKPLKEHIIKKQGINYIDEVGFKQITDDIKDYKDKNSNSASSDEVATDTDYINCLNENTNYLKDQIKIKDQQIMELNGLLKQALRLNENNQVLLKDKPKLIEEPKKGFWEKLLKL